MQSANIQKQINVPKFVGKYVSAPALTLLEIARDSRTWRTWEGLQGY